MIKYGQLPDCRNSMTYMNISNCILTTIHVSCFVRNASTDISSKKVTFKKYNTVLPTADSTRTVRLFQEVAVWKPLYINLPNKFCFKGHILNCWWQKMITIGFMGTMYVCLLNKPIELYQSTTYFAISLMSPQIFTNISKTPDRVHFTKSMV